MELKVWNFSVVNFIRKFHEEKSLIYASYTLHSCVSVSLRKAMGQAQEKGLIWFTSLFSLFDNGYNLLMMCGNFLIPVSVLILTWWCDALILLADICMIRYDSKQNGTGSGEAYAFNNALLALRLVVLGDDISCYDMVMSCPWQNLIWFLGLHSWC